MSASITVPDGFKLHTENSAHILLPETDEAFLNPIQEFNRDLSVACIRVWSEEMIKAKGAVWRAMQDRKARKKPRRDDAPEASLAASLEGPQGVPDAIMQEVGEPKQVDSAPEQNESQRRALDKTDRLEDESPPEQDAVKAHQPPKFVILEALSATGLRSIRYAKEIPHIKYVIANDLSPDAVKAIRRNVECNGLGGTDVTTESQAASESETGARLQPVSSPVKVNQGDACALMYNHRADRDRVDVVDLDPYGTAAPFIDASVQCVRDKGLLCITCTDLQVLATTNYPEKCFANYGGTPVKAPFCHEAALRLVLNAISTSAGRYGRYIEPLLSLSIDFYVRMFIRIRDGALGAKKAASKSAVYYVCSSCHSFYPQHLGRIVEHPAAGSGKHVQYKVQAGPPVPEKCPECNSTLHLAGPMWSGPLHDHEFASRALEHVENNKDGYGTSARMMGMLTVAKEELDSPFYFQPSQMAGLFHCVCPPLDDITSALLNAGFKVSRSHAAAGSLKTDAPHNAVHDIYRSWTRTHPVKMDKVSQTSPSYTLLTKEIRTAVDFTRHSQLASAASSEVKILRYQPNPTPNWGPGKKAKGSGGKRKRDEEQMGI